MPSEAKRGKQRIEANRYKKLYGLKYVILVAMIAAAVGGTLQIGWLDPIALFEFRHLQLSLDAAPELAR